MDLVRLSSIGLLRFGLFFIVSQVFLKPVFWVRIWTGFLFLELYLVFRNHVLGPVWTEFLLELNQAFRNQFFGSGSGLDPSCNYVNHFEINVLGQDLDWIPLLRIIKIVSKPMFWVRIWTGFHFLELIQVFRNQYFGSVSELFSSFWNYIKCFKTNVRIWTSEL
jgi:hypothetical protein